MQFNFRQLRERFCLSSIQLIIFTVLFVSIAHNQKFFTLFINTINLLSLSGLAFFITIILLMFWFLATPLLLFAYSLWLKPLLSFLLILSAILGYYTQKLGVIFDEDMIQNIVDNITESNHREAVDLMSAPLFIYISLWGILPSILLWLVPIKNLPKLITNIWQRIKLILIPLLLAVLIFGLNYKYSVLFSRENRYLNSYITPSFALDAFGHWSFDKLQPPQELTINSNGAKQNKQSKNRIVGLMVVGETARADRFSLNGYARKTNPLLEKYGDITKPENSQLINFSNTSACGTSTAYSVPCMFYLFGANKYSPNIADFQENVLDVLEKAQIKVVWLDNNSGCKDVCNRVESLDIYKLKPEGFWDEEFTEFLDKYTNTDKDLLIVLHTLGSHGPNYFKRVPPKFRIFTPYCQSSAPETCSQEEINNSYDNTIYYTDYVLDKFINWLKNKSVNGDKTFMLYASDHGESLGENGIYLHGLPRVIAPKEQLQVPMILWLSENWQNINNKISRNVDKPLTHDNLPHTLMGMFAVESIHYKSELDLVNVINQ